LNLASIIPLNYFTTSVILGFVVVILLETVSQTIALFELSN